MRDVVRGWATTSRRTPPRRSAPAPAASCTRPGTGAAQQDERAVLVARALALGVQGRLDAEARELPGLVHLGPRREAGGIRAGAARGGGAGPRVPNREEGLRGDALPLPPGARRVGERAQRGLTQPSAFREPSC